MPWRYQPVYIEEEDEKVFSLCEAHFDDDGKLKAWSDPFKRPQGNNMDDLRGELTHMLSDAWKWMPVLYSKLRVGMVLQRAISQEDAEGIANVIDAQAALCRQKTVQ